MLRVLEPIAHAPTAVRDAERADRRPSRRLAGRRSSSTPIAAPAAIADLGTGAGFPGLALAVALPGAEVRLLESQRRKCAFLERAVRRARGSQNARVVCARAEEWREGLASYDVVVARALAPQPVVLEYAAPLLRVGGTLVDWRGRRDAAEEDAAARAARGARPAQRVEIRRVEPFAGARDRHLHVYVEGRGDAERFPGGRAWRASARSGELSRRERSAGEGTAPTPARSSRVAATALACSGWAPCTRSPTRRAAWARRRRR